MQARGRMLEIFDTDAAPEARADAGESLGWLGDPRDLRAFVEIEGGDYKLEVIGKALLLFTDEVGRIFFDIRILNGLFF